MTPRFILTITLAVCSPFIASAGNTKPWPTPVHHHTIIESVSADSITIDSAAGSKTYKIIPTTEITFKGETVPVDQLQAGMRVTIVPDAADDGTAGEINANDPPKDPTPKPGK